VELKYILIYIDLGAEKLITAERKGEKKLQLKLRDLLVAQQFLNFTNH
jgi:hypothetical protein